MASALQTIARINAQYQYKPGKMAELLNMFTAPSRRAQEIMLQQEVANVKTAKQIAKQLDKSKEKAEMMATNLQQDQSGNFTVVGGAVEKLEARKEQRRQALEQDNFRRQQAGDAQRDKEVEALQTEQRSYSDQINSQKENLFGATKPVEDMMDEWRKDQSTKNSEAYKKSERVQDEKQMAAFFAEYKVSRGKAQEYLKKSLNANKNTQQYDPKEHPYIGEKGANVPYIKGTYIPLDTATAAYVNEYGIGIASKVWTRDELLNTASEEKLGVFDKHNEEIRKQFEEQIKAVEASYRQINVKAQLDKEFTENTFRAAQLKDQQQIKNYIRLQNKIEDLEDEYAAYMMGGSDPIKRVQDKLEKKGVRSPLDTPYIYEKEGDFGVDKEGLDIIEFLTDLERPKRRRRKASENNESVSSAENNAENLQDITEDPDGAGDDQQGTDGVGDDQQGTDGVGDDQQGTDGVGDDQQDAGEGTEEAKATEEAETTDGAEETVVDVQGSYRFAEQKSDKNYTKYDGATSDEVKDKTRTVSMDGLPENTSEIVPVGTLLQVKADHSYGYELVGYDDNDQPIFTLVTGLKGTKAYKKPVPASDDEIKRIMKKAIKDAPRKTVVKEAPPVVEETTPVVEKTTPVVKETTPIVEEAPVEDDGGLMQFFQNLRSSIKGRKQDEDKGEVDPTEGEGKADPTEGEGEVDPTEGKVEEDKFSNEALGVGTGKFYVETRQKVASGKREQQYANRPIKINNDFTTTIGEQTKKKGDQYKTLKPITDYNTGQIAGFELKVYEYEEERMYKTTTRARRKKMRSILSPFPGMRKKTDTKIIKDKIVARGDGKEFTQLLDEYLTAGGESSQKFQERVRQLQQEQQSASNPPLVENPDVTKLNKTINNLTREDNLFKIEISDVSKQKFIESIEKGNKFEDIQKAHLMDHLRTQNVNNNFRRVLVKSENGKNLVFDDDGTPFKIEKNGTIILVNKDGGVKQTFTPNLQKPVTAKENSTYVTVLKNLAFRKDEKEEEK